MENKEFFYGRISAIDQKEARQLEVAKELNIEDRNIFIDKRSGKNFDRPQYQTLKQILRKGDTLYIKSIDRLRT